MLLTACNGSESAKNTIAKEIKKEIKMLRPEKAEEIKLKLGMPFDEFRKANPSVKVSNKMRVNFHEKHWSTKKPASIHFELDDNKILELPYSISLFFGELEEKSKLGLKIFQLQTGITKADLMDYEESRVKFHAFLQGLLKEGWERVITYSRPRINGRQAMHYKLAEDDMYYLDPKYEPTLEEWKKLETGGMSSSNYWTLHYKNKIFLEINLGVVPHKTDSTLASYLMFITIRDAEEEAMRYMAPKDKLKWKEHWVERLEKALKKRIMNETKIKTKGYTIDESYEDYKIDPKEW